MKNKKVILSVIVPVYNGEKSIEKCINTILNMKSIEDIEVIVVNDGSTDNTKEILNKLKRDNNNLKVITSNNKGVSSARNIGLHNSSGKYITFVDADDWVDENLYDKLIYYLKKNDNIDILKFPIRYVYPNKVKNINQHFEENLKMIDKKNYNLELYKLYENSYELSNVFCMIYKKKLVYPKIEFREDIKYGEDFLFNLDAILNSNNIVFYKTKEKYNYYIDKNSCSRIKQKKRLYKNFIDAQEVYKILYEKMSLEFPEKDFLKKLKVRYLRELEITIAKLTTVLNYEEFNKSIMQSFSTNIFLNKIIEDYKENLKCNSYRCLLLYKLNFKFLYFYCIKLEEVLKGYIKNLIFYSKDN